jgi:hypothetical protein
MNMQEIFDKFLTGTENDKAEVREFLMRHENMHMLYSREFLNHAIQNATLLGVNPDAAQAKSREEWVDAVMAGETDESFEDWRFPWDRSEAEH